MPRRTTKKATTRKSTKRGRAKSRIVSVNFEGVETRAGSDVPEGEYLAKVVEVEEYESQSSGNPVLKWKFEIVKGEEKGKVLFHNTSLQQQALWNVRGLLEAAGIETPDSAFDIDLDEMVDVEVGVGVVIREWEGRDQSRIADFFPVEEFEENGEEEEEDEEGEDEENEEEGEEESITPEDIKAMKSSELESAVEEYELDVDLSKLKNLARKRNAVVKAMTEAGYFD